jgi:type IV secretion system protein VirB10
MSADLEGQQKAIAESLSLRAPPPPVARISRRTLMIVGGVVLAGLTGAVIWSTRAPPAKTPEPPAAAASPRPPEKIASLPRDYLRRAEAPVLGPPLPGDLGRPMLSAGVTETTPLVSQAQGAAPPVSDYAASRPGAAGQEARASGLFLTVVAPRVASARVEAAAPSIGEAAPAAGDARTTSPERLQSPLSPYVLQAGAIIPAALVTGLRSDAQGVALAQVTQDVYDSLGGRHLLVPAGSRLVGEYASTTSVGQQRLAVAWTRLILPSGRSIVLDKLPAADAQGMAGLQDGVDRHLTGVWGAAALSTVLAVGAEAGSSDESDLTRAVRRGTSQAASEIGQQVVGRSLDRTPTLTVRPGAPLRVLLTRDLVLEPYRKEAGR